MSDSLSRIEQLEIAGAIAPVLRDRLHSGRVRTITVVDKDGKPVRKISDVELTSKLASRAKIEMAVAAGQRPKAIVCQCGMLRMVPKRGVVPVSCVKCAKRMKLEQKRARRAANPEKAREQARAWKAANPEKAREQARARRARKKAAKSCT
jgi:hypothetical protein